MTGAVPIRAFRSRVGPFLLVMIAATVGFLVGADDVFADNCSDPGDCWGTAGGAAAAAAAAGAVAAAAGGAARRAGRAGTAGAGQGEAGGSGGARYEGPPGYHGPHPEYDRRPSGTPGVPGYDPGTFRSGAPAPRQRPPRGFWPPPEPDPGQIKALDPDEGKPPHAIRG